MPRCIGFMALRLASRGLLLAVELAVDSAMEERTDPPGIGMRGSRGARVTVEDELELTVPATERAVDERMEPAEEEALSLAPRGRGGSTGETDSESSKGTSDSEADESAQCLGASQQ